MSEVGTIKSVVIVGGGTAGWMAAASLQQHFKNTPVSITLVESSQIETVGVGEATIPTIRRFYAALGMRDVDVLRETQGTCKLGIQFNDWLEPGSSFIHPFGLFGQDVRNIGFHHFWRKLRDAGDNAPLADYSLGASLALNNRFTTPATNPPSSLSVFDWALHFDATLFAGLMRKSATANGCTHVEGKIVEVCQNPDNGFIQSLRLESGGVVDGDLFIDCSGFHGLLIDKTMGVGYQDWSHWLFCDSACVVQSGNISEPTPYTRVNAQEAGWQWRIPLQSRTGNGHVYSSKYMDDEAAQRTLVANTEGDLLHEPRKLTFRPGRRDRAWEKNCIALGLASGFLEPLESTSIALIETGIERIKQLFPVGQIDQACIDEYNEISALEYERVRDFIILHYKATARRDSEFWRNCAKMDIPDTLQKKIDLYKSRGYFLRYRWEMFHPASWLAIYDGFGVLPDGYDPAVDSFDTKYLRESLSAMKKSVNDVVQATQTHQQFLNQVHGT